MNTTSSKVEVVLRSALNLGGARGAAGECRRGCDREGDRRRPEALRERADARGHLLASKQLVLEAASAHGQRAAAGFPALVDERHETSLRRRPDKSNGG